MSDHDDATIERVAQAMWDAYPAVWVDDMPDEWSEDEKDNRHMTEITWDEFVRHNLVMNREYDAYRADDYRRMARAAVAAMEPEPLEDVRDILRSRTVTRLSLTSSGSYYVALGEKDWGTGPTIDAAIRAAVANEQESADGPR